MKKPDDPVIDFLLRQDVSSAIIRLIGKRCLELDQRRPLSRHVAEWKSDGS